MTGYDEPDLMLPGSPFFMFKFFYSVTCVFQPFTSWINNMAVETLKKSVLWKKLIGLQYSYSPNLIETKNAALASKHFWVA